MKVRGHHLEDTAVNRRVVFEVPGNKDPRERRKAATTGERRPEPSSVAERSQQLIEAGIWPVYSP